MVTQRAALTRSLPAQALTRLWSPGDRPTELPSWFRTMTRRARPKRGEGVRYREWDDENANVIENFEPWNRGDELLPDQESDGEPDCSGAPAPKPTAFWRALFARHYVISHRWLHGCVVG